MDGKIPKETRLVENLDLPRVASIDSALSTVTDVETLSDIDIKNEIDLGSSATKRSFGEEASLRNFEYKLCNMKKENNQLSSEEKARKCDKDYDSQKPDGIY